MKKQMKKLICLTIAVIMAIAVIPVTASAGLKGDLDENGRVTALDARTVLRIAARLVRFEEVFIELADMDSNNKITSGDARAILRIAAKIDSQPGVFTPDTDADGNIVLDNAIGMNINDFKSYMSMGQAYGDSSYEIRGRGTRFVLEGSGSATPDNILMFDITDKGCVYKGITTGMTKAQVKAAFDGKGTFESDMGDLSSFNTVIDGNTVVIDFVGDTVRSIIVSSPKRQITHDVSTMLFRPVEQSFPEETADYTTADAGEYVTYSFRGFEAFVFTDYDGSFVRGAVISERNDFNFDSIHVGDDFSKVTDYAQNHNYKTDTSDFGVNDLILDAEYCTVLFNEQDGKVSQIIISYKGYEDRI